MFSESFGSRYFVCILIRVIQNWRSGSKIPMAKIFSHRTIFQLSIDQICDNVRIAFTFPISHNIIRFQRRKVRSVILQVGSCSAFFMSAEPNPDFLSDRNSVGPGQCRIWFFLWVASGSGSMPPGSATLLLMLHCTFSYHYFIIINVFGSGHYWKTLLKHCECIFIWTINLLDFLSFHVLYYS